MLSEEFCSMCSNRINKDNYYTTDGAGDLPFCSKDCALEAADECEANVGYVIRSHVYRVQNGIETMLKDC